MQPASVLAGPVEFSAADIAFLFLVLLLSALALTAPGWVVLAEASRRRARASGSERGTGFWACLGGAFLGMAISAAVSAAVAAALVDAGHVLPAMVVTSWAACWGLALALWPFSRQRTREGWGR
jgi:hypothetical protein